MASAIIAGVPMVVSMACVTQRLGLPAGRLGTVPVQRITTSPARLVIKGGGDVGNPPARA